MAASVKIPDDINLRFIDLFAGIGGFHRALHDLGCQCVFASELDESARLTYERNFYDISPELFDNGLFNDDIRKISANEIPDFDILCAGFPCQPFSQAGYKKGFADGSNSERGNLFFNIVDILEAKQPKAFFLENVRGIVNHDQGRTFRVIREILEDELGYSFYFKVVKATDYGLPQHRPRAFMIGFRDEGLLKGFDFPPPIPLRFNMSDVFGGDCSREIGFTLRVGGAGSNINDRRNWDSYLVDGEVVKIQPNHALKIQGFPDNFKLPNSRGAAMKQLGNSVAVDAVRECASELINHLGVIDKRNEGSDLMNRTRNKGEWTELYTFLKLVVEKELVFSDEDLNATAEKLSVHKVTTLNIPQTVKLSGSQFSVVDKTFGENMQNTNISESEIVKLRDDIISGKGTFELDYAEKIFKNLGIQMVRGGTSAQKADIVIDVGYQGQFFENQGFGIKSYLGSKPTLLNASGSNTNFVYELVDFKEEYLEEVNGINTTHKIKDRIAKILSKGCSFKFTQVEAQTMQDNLEILDDGMPSLISKMLINFYMKRISSIHKNLETLVSADVELNASNIGLEGYQVKVKRFLVAILLGMFTGKKWDGKYTANGSIVVKKSGSQVGFHIVKLGVLENYLLKSIKFDTPSSTRHRFASVYKERDGKFYFKLNLQLRY
ncbi:HpaII family restriction endonuclease [Paracoccaceae bacterium]|nr:HpaII family restriction endonuclease [Paracoccaceae bacterium]